MISSYSVYFMLIIDLQLIVILIHFSILSYFSISINSIIINLGHMSDVKSGSWNETCWKPLR